MRKPVLLIIPAYNEEMNIGTVLRQLQDAGIPEQMDLLVINDGSRDNTLQVARDCGVEVLDQSFNMGYGAALQSGYKYAVRYGYEYVLQMDADGQHDLRSLKALLDRIRGNVPQSGDPDDRGIGETRVPDIVIGSRFLKGSETFAVSGLKKFAIAQFCFVIHSLTGYHLTDPTSGLQALNRSAFTYFSRYQNFDIAYPDLNMIIQMLLRGYHVEEVPAIMHERTAGVSMHSGLWSAMRYMIIMTLSTWNVYTATRKASNRKKAS